MNTLVHSIRISGPVFVEGRVTGALAFQSPRMRHWFHGFFATPSRRRLQIVSDADPGAIARVVERFQNLNIVPRRLSAEFSSNNLLHIEVDVCGIPDEQLVLIIGKIRQATSILNVYWYRPD
jgi:hypothetical protein